MIEHRLLKATVKAILEHPWAYEWSLQGFGMLRTYISKQHRLHVWDGRYAVPGVSVIHDHPWAFESMVVAGRLLNQRYVAVGDEITHKFRRIKCGPGGGLLNEPDGLVGLAPYSPVEVYEAGSVYRQAANEIHASMPEDGTVTIVERTFREDTEHARVFWPFADRWGSAEPAPANYTQVKEITQQALARWFQ